MTESDLLAVLADRVWWETGVTLAEVVSPRKEGYICEARTLLMGYLYNRGLTQAQVAALVGRERSTVTHDLRRFERLVPVWEGS